MTKQDAIKLYGLAHTTLQELICVYHELGERDRKSLLPVIDMVKQVIDMVKQGISEYKTEKGPTEYRQTCHYHCPYNYRLTTVIKNDLCPGCGYRPSYEVAQYG